MKLTPVESLPKQRASMHNLQDIIEEFVQSNHQIAKIDLDENDYKSLESCRSCMFTAVKRSGYKSVRVKLRGDSVYLVKT